MGWDAQVLPPCPLEVNAGTQELAPTAHGNPPLNPQAAGQKRQAGQDASEAGVGKRNTLWAKNKEIARQQEPLAVGQIQAQPETGVQNLYYTFPFAPFNDPPNAHTIFPFLPNARPDITHSFPIHSTRAAQPTAVVTARQQHGATSPPPGTIIQPPPLSSQPWVYPGGPKTWPNLASQHSYSDQFTAFPYVGAIGRTTSTEASQTATTDPPKQALPPALVASDLPTPQHPGGAPAPNCQRHSNTPTPTPRCGPPEAASVTLENVHQALNRDLA
ncbi:hypothetical protein CLAIMM_14895 [Cladophialophora immunda]|nr:hypothetical protein CLAIMM_14895 [Cladophialophora immunda]